jgi:geranylgeranyl reductase family protein
MPDTCDVLIVGGGPAGSTCARALVRAGLDVVVLDKATFPRDKTCAGWITPAVVDTLQLPLHEYRKGRVLQPITAFRTSRLGGREVHTRFDETVSYGIRRCEFDDFLLQRSGARLRLGEPLKSLRGDYHRNGRVWIANNAIAPRLIVGAGGHFCPVAQQIGGASHGDEPIVAAQEIEVHLTPEQAAACKVAGDTPELFLCQDLAGYGWVFRKGPVLNVGLGRQDRHHLASHVHDFYERLVQAGRIPANLPWRWKGHAYLLRDSSPRRVVDDGVLLIGDAAGLAYAKSGEGIRPAIESGLLAAQTILEARGSYTRADLEPYRTRLTARFGAADRAVAFGADGLPGAVDGSDTSGASGANGGTSANGTSRANGAGASISHAIAGALLANRWFTRHVFLRRWFLRAHEPALPPLTVSRR